MCNPRTVVDTNGLPVHLFRPLHRRLLGRPLRGAEVMRGVDQRDMGQGLREVAGLAAGAGIEFLGQEAEIIGERGHTAEQRLAFANSPVRT